MKNGHFSSESILAFRDQVSAEGGSTNISDSGGDNFLTSLLNSDHSFQPLIAEGIGDIRGEYIDTYEYTRCERPNGSLYGTSGRCRMGTETSAKPESKGTKEVKRRSIPDQELADMDSKSLGKLKKSYQKVLEGAGPRLSDDQRKFLKSELTRIKDFDDMLKINNAVREGNQERSKKRDLLKFRLDELQDKLDDAVTVREQQRISSAISDTKKRLQSDELKDRYQLSPEEKSRALGT